MAAMVVDADERVELVPHNEVVPLITLTMVENVKAYLNVPIVGILS